MSTDCLSNQFLAKTNWFHIHQCKNVLQHTVSNNNEEEQAWDELCSAKDKVFNSLGFVLVRFKF